MMKMRTLLACVAVLVLAASAARAVPGDQASFDKGAAAYDAGRYEEAFKIFHDLADNEDLAAMRNVALMYRRGQGVPRDPQKAMKWYRRAAEAGLGTAQADLGIMLLDGEAGESEPEEAVMWLTYASDAGHAIAQFRLGELYEKGENVTQNLELAKKLYTTSAARGDKEAAIRLAALMGLKPKNAMVLPGGSEQDRRASASGIDRTTAPKTITLQPAQEASLGPNVPDVLPSILDEGTMHKTFSGPTLKHAP